MTFSRCMNYSFCIVHGLIAVHTAKLVYRLLYPIKSSEPLAPDEIILDIFHYLSVQDLRKTLQVCKQWKRITLDHTLWKFPVNMKISALSRQVIDDFLLDDRISETDRANVVYWLSTIPKIFLNKLELFIIPKGLTFEILLSIAEAKGLKIKIEGTHAGEFLCCQGNKVIEKTYIIAASNFFEREHTSHLIPIEKAAYFIISSLYDTSRIENCKSLSYELTWHLSMRINSPYITIPSKGIRI